MLLLIIALFGLIVPNGIFIYWLFTEFKSVAEVVSNKLAAAFIIDAFMAMLLLAYRFAAKPIGKISWHWFIVFSLLGGLGFSLPFYWWLNQKFDVPEGKAV
ncbi:MAG TPA: hypothetical protein VF604_17505 [Pyrinomonadaceae bacterium]|jgi:hypothetical protein